MNSEPAAFLDLVTPHRALEDEPVAVFRSPLHDARFAEGPEVEGFEREFATTEAITPAGGADAIRLFFKD